DSILPNGSRVARSASCHCSLVTWALKSCDASCQLSAYCPESTKASHASADCCASCSGFCCAWTADETPSSSASAKKRDRSLDSICASLTVTWVLLSNLNCSAAVSTLAGLCPAGTAGGGCPYASRSLSETLH